MNTIDINDVVRKSLERRAGMIVQRIRQHWLRSDTFTPETQKVEEFTCIITP